MTQLMRMEKGKRYQAIVPVRLNRMVSVAPWAWTGDSRDIPPGTVVTYVGTREFGSDPVPEDTFQTEDGKCWQGPSVWGATPAGLFEEVRS